jgi:phosphatidylinositol alpha-1,6-mannosyltransferase
MGPEIGESTTSVMSILLLTEVFPPRTGGSGRWFWEVYRRLPRSCVRVVAGECPGQEHFDRAHDLRVFRMPLTLKSWGVLNPSSLMAYGKAVRSLVRRIRTEPIGMVHCGRCLPEGLMGAWVRRATGIPFLCYAHGEEMNYARSSRELAFLTRRVLGAAGLVIANSRSTAGMLRDEWGLTPSRIRVLHPGVDTRAFAPAPRDDGLRAELGWGGRPVVLTVGRLQERKGHDQMIRALPAIRSAMPDVLYAIVGDGEMRGNLRELAASEGVTDHVQFLGELDDRRMIQGYQQCDLFALPNRRVGQDIEGFGIVLLEAQACGKPVLAGDSGGTAETMRIPETGRVVACEGPVELAAMVIDLLSDRDRLDRMGRAAREWVVARFDWEALYREAEALFRVGPAETVPTLLAAGVTA